MTRTIAIVGGGFCGTLVAVHLLREAPPTGLRVLLINASGLPARGLAYGTRSDRHLLNVPVGGMSALPDQPDHFLRYCQAEAPTTQAGDFVARAIYGQYLAALLATATQQVRPGTTLEQYQDCVLGLTERRDGGVSLQLRNGSEVLVDEVVLAFGHFPPATPVALDPTLTAGGHWVGDPWAPAALDRIGATQPVLLLGSGLTALDVVLALQQQGHHGRIDCLSRRGLTPLPHRAAGTAQAWTDIEVLLPRLAQGARAATQALRAAAARAPATGHDWRDVIAALRSHIPSIWQAWPLAERRRFLRHLQPYWDVHRHRCAPAAADTWAEQVRARRLHLHAGRLEHSEPTDAGWQLHWRSRGDHTPRSVEAAWVINCTGPATGLRASGSPLIAQLLQQGDLCADVLNLGLIVDDDYRVCRANGRCWPSIRYVGPLLKAREWEATAVPELRRHARAVARRLLQTEDGIDTPPLLSPSLNSQHPAKAASLRHPHYTGDFE